jgi:hypothetical protein
VIIKNRFSNEARKAFAAIRKITTYHEWEKRDGGFFTRCLID